MTDAMEAVGQDVEEKATDELVRGKPHDAAAAAAAIILIGERHLIVIDGDKSRIGDRRAMRVAGEIGQYALGAAEGRLGVDDEGALPQRAHTFGERGGLGKRDQVAEETEFASTESGFQAVEEQTAEGVRQGADGEQEVGFSSDPSPAVEGDAAAGDETMDMRMMGQRLPPGVQDGDEADCGAEAFGGEGHERLGRRAHQETVDRLLVLESDLGRRRRQGEDDVEVGNRQQLSLTSGEPPRARRPLTLPAMAVSARVVDDAGEPAIVAALDMATERRRAAGCDRADHAPLDASKMSSVRSFVTFTVSVENVGQFERRPRRHRLIRRRHLKRQSIQRALGPGDHMRRDACVARRRRQILVSEQDLDDANVDAALQEMGREAVAQDVHAHALVDAGRDAGRTAGGVQDCRLDRPVLVAAREQEPFGMCATPIAAQDTEQLLGQHDVALLAALAAFDSDDHAVAVDIGRLQATTSDTRRPAA